MNAVFRAGAERLGPFLVILLLLGSIGAGLLCLLFLGLGYLPGLSNAGPSLQSWRLLLADPRLPAAFGTTLFTGFLSTLMSLALALGLLSALDPAGKGTGRLVGRWAHRLALIIVSMPHAALALGLAFLLAPGGWLPRMAASLFGDAGSSALPVLVQDALGLGLVLALVLKEAPFLFIVGAVALHQMAPQARLALAASMGYGRHMAWIKIVLPILYRQMRLPVLAVLAYSLSVVDMARLLGPGNPSTLAVLVVQWSGEPELGRRFVAGAAGMLQFLVVLGALGLWILGERQIGRMARPFLSAGRRDWPAPVACLGRIFISLGVLCQLVLPLLAILSLLLWSLAASWQHPSVLPQGLTLANWRRAAAEASEPLAASLTLASLSTALALLLAVACLERERGIRALALKRVEPILFLPLLVPDVSFLIGIQIVLLLSGLNGGWLALVWFHLLFVFPYVFLALRDPWRALDPRLDRAARSLGASRLRVLLHVKIPLLKGSLALSAAIGMAVSLSLYLPTVLGGEGRIVTLATEAVALGSGGDRRVAGVYGIMQAGLIFLGFALAALVMRGRRWNQASASGTLE